MKASILNKLTPAARKEVIAMEARLRILDETIAQIEAIEKAMDEEDKGGLL